MVSYNIITVHIIKEEGGAHAKKKITKQVVQYLLYTNGKIVNTLLSVISCFFPEVKKVFRFRKSR